MKYVHYHLRNVMNEAIYLFVIQFHYDCDIIVIDKVTIHPIRADGIILENVVEDNQIITDEIYNDAISMLHDDGLC
jgi:hypothetical protein